MGKFVVFWVFCLIGPSPVMGEKGGKSEKSSLAGVGFAELIQGCGGALKRKKGPKKTPTALFRVVLHHGGARTAIAMATDGNIC